MTNNSTYEIFSREIAAVVDTPQVSHIILDCHSFLQFVRSKHYIGMGKTYPNLRIMQIGVQHNNRIC